MTLLDAMLDVFSAKTWRDALKVREVVSGLFASGSYMATIAGGKIDL